MASDNTPRGSKRPDSLVRLITRLLDLIILLAPITHPASDVEARNTHHDPWDPNESLYLAGAPNRTCDL